MGKGLQRQYFKFKHVSHYRCTWRGGGFRDECKGFFERMTGKFYRVPGFLATSMEIKTALTFIRYADRTHPRILWCILVRV